MDLASFVQQLQEILARQEEQPARSYFDLGLVPAVTADELALRTLPPFDPLDEVFRLMLPEIKIGNIDKVKLAVNEILKDLLRKAVVSSDPAEMTRQYLRRLRLIFQACLREDFLYSLELWEYLSICLDNAGSYLYARRLQDACRVFLEQAAAMGKLAAQRGLHTSSLQHFLRTLEVSARENGDHELAELARNHRFNLEG